MAQAFPIPDVAPVIKTILFSLADTRDGAVQGRKRYSQQHLKDV